MATRSTNTVKTSPAAKAKATVTKPVGLDQPQAAHVEQDDESAVRAYFERLKADFKLSWTRERVICLVLGMVTAGVTGYMLGSLVGMLSAAVLATTTSMFLGVIVYVIGMLLALYASGTLGGLVAEYVACGAAREHVKLVSDTVRGWFSPRRSVNA